MRNKNHRLIKYSDYPYGNELLMLPYTSKGVTSSDQETSLSFSLEAEFLKIDKPDNELLYWFRWTIGHHISFISWLLIDKYLSDNINLISVDKNKVTRNINRCLSLLKLLSCMYIYSSTVLEDVYNSSIRKFMRLYHSAFSAKWAKDYLDLKKTISGYSRLENEELSSKKIKVLFDESKITHITIAEKLVKNRKSLLQHFHNANTEGVTKEAHKVYDCFFIVHRVSKITEKKLIYNLVKRLMVVKDDVSHNGVFAPEDKDIEILLKNAVTKKYLNNFEQIIDDNIKAFL